MTEPTEDQILLRAKALCADDGYAWDEEEAPRDTEDGDEVPPMAGSAERIDYLTRARLELLREQGTGRL